MYPSLDLLAAFPTRYLSNVVFFGQLLVQPVAVGASLILFIQSTFSYAFQATDDVPPCTLVVENESQLSAPVSLMLDATVTVLSGRRPEASVSCSIW
jgi:hypothetical protein